MLLHARKSISRLLSGPGHPVAVANRRLRKCVSYSVVLALPSHRKFHGLFYHKLAISAMPAVHTAKAACVQTPLYSKYDRKSASRRRHQRLVDISLAYSPHRKPGRDLTGTLIRASKNFPAPSSPLRKRVYHFPHFQLRDAAPRDDHHDIVLYSYLGDMK